MLLLAGLFIVSVALLALLKWMLSVVDPASFRPSVVNTPVIKLPVIDTPGIEPSAVNTYGVEPRATNTPGVKTWVENLPGVQPPVSEMLGIKPPVNNLPGVQPPATCTLNMKPPVNNLPGVQPSAISTPDIETLVNDVSSIQQPTSSTSSIETRVKNVLGVQAPAIGTPGIETPVKDIPDIQAPVMSTPVIETPLSNIPGSKPSVKNSPEIMPPVTNAPIHKSAINEPHMDGVLLPPNKSETRRATQCWVFMHMRHSGYDSARRTLVQRWKGKEVVFDSVQWRRGEEYAAVLMNQTRWSLIHGGYVEALRRRVGRTCKWFTLFRHPVARLLSHFHHCQESAGDPLCPMNTLYNRGSLDLFAFAKYWGNQTLRQFALVEVSSSAAEAWVGSAGKNKSLPSWNLVREYLRRNIRRNDRPDAELDVLLRSVQNTLRTSYAAIGIAEDFNTSMRLFDRALSMPGLDWSTISDDLSDNYSLEGSSLESLVDARITNLLRLDILLYEYALELFRQQASEYDVAG